eukprot:Rmarinus@m.5957
MQKNIADCQNNLKLLQLAMVEAKVHKPFDVMELSRGGRKPNYEFLGWLRCHYDTMVFFGEVDEFERIASEVEGAVLPLSGVLMRLGNIVQLDSLSSINVLESCYTLPSQPYGKPREETTSDDPSKTGLDGATTDEGKVPASLSEENAAQLEGTGMIPPASARSGGSMRIGSLTAAMSTAMSSFAVIEMSESRNTNVRKQLADALLAHRRALELIRALREEYLICSHEMANGNLSLDECLTPFTAVRALGLELEASHDPEDPLMPPVAPSHGSAPATARTMASSVRSNRRAGEGVTVDPALHIGAQAQSLKGLLRPGYTILAAALDREKDAMKLLCSTNRSSLTAEDVVETKRAIKALQLLCEEHRLNEDHSKQTVQTAQFMRSSRRFMSLTQDDENAPLPGTRHDFWHTHHFVSSSAH